MENKTVTTQDVELALQSVIDPHIGIDIWTLGFIYDVKITDGTKVYILMTLTTPACPLGDSLESMMKEALESVGATDVTIEKTFDPPWEPPAALKAMMRPPEDCNE